MTAAASWLPLAAVATPAVAAGLILASGSRPSVREAWTALASLVVLAITARLAALVLGGARPTTTLAGFAFGTDLALRADPFGALFALLASFLWLVTSVYSVGYVRTVDEHGQTRYFAAFAASIAATLGVAFAADLLTLFVFYELLTAATYPLVVHAGSDEARRAGRRYVAYTLTGGVAVLAGLALVQASAGTLAFVPGGVAAVAADPTLARVAFGLLVVGFGVKTAIVPLHGWLPAAMVAPTPVSGLLHAVAVVKSGAFGLGRVVMYVYGPEAVVDLGAGDVLAVAAAATMLVGGALALRQRKLKRALAYSTVSQLSYIALGFALGTPTATFGALLHVPAHAFMKITLFFAVGVVSVETGVASVDGLAGVARRLPATMTSFAVAAAGLAGFPLVAGFVSKWYLLLGSLQAGRPAFAAALLAAGALKVLLFWPMLSAAFFADRSAPGRDDERDSAGKHAPAPDGGPGRSGGQSGRSGGRPGRSGGRATQSFARETAPALLFPVLVVAAGAVALGVAPDAFPLFDLAAATVAEVFG